MRSNTAAMYAFSASAVVQWRPETSLKTCRTHKHASTHHNHVQGKCCALDTHELRPNRAPREPADRQTDSAKPPSTPPERRAKRSFNTTNNTPTYLRHRPNATTQSRASDVVDSLVLHGLPAHKNEVVFLGDVNPRLAGLVIHTAAAVGTSATSVGEKQDLGTPPPPPPPPPHKSMQVSWLPATTNKANASSSHTKQTPANNIHQVPSTYTHSQQPTRTRKANTLKI